MRLPIRPQRLRVIEAVSSRPIVAKTPIATRSQGPRVGELGCFCRSLSLSKELVTTALGVAASAKNLKQLEGQDALPWGDPTGASGSFA